MTEQITEQKAKEMLQAKLTCMELESLACIEKGCSMKCTECSYNYAQGTRGEHKKALDMAIKALEEIKQYRALGTVEELRVARDKQVGKKVVFVHPLQLDDGGDYMCPSCETGTVYDAYGQQSNHCSYCGQKLNWEEV